MNTSSSDFTSGCESGWTQYFDKSSSSSSSQNSPQTCNMKMIYEDYFEQDKHNCYEDLSMVSDASSGPRPYNDEECFNHRNECSPETINKSSMKKNRNGKVREKSMTQLDDTASSHSKSKTSMYYNNTLHGQETSAASLTKGRSSRKKCFGL